MGKRAVQPAFSSVCPAPAQGSSRRSAGFDILSDLSGREGRVTISAYRVLVADDHPLYRTALSNIVSDAFSDVLVSECEDVASALAALQAGDIDLVLLDLSMPDAEGLDGLRQLRSASPSTPVIICSAHTQAPTMREAFKLGISGYLPKSSGAEVTRHALQLVRSGGIYVPSEVLVDPAGEEPVEQAGAPGGEASNPGGLTPRQGMVLGLLERGLSNKQIARELDIGEITVKAHVSAILRKLGVENRVQAVLAARELKS